MGLWLLLLMLLPGWGDLAWAAKHAFLGDLYEYVG
jgi:hypothetical protein